MSFSLQQLPDEPIVIQTVGKDFSYATDGAAVLDQLTEILDRQPQPIFWIYDAVDAAFNIDDVIAGTNLAARQRTVFRHPKLRESIIITQNRMAELAVKGMTSPIFGNVRIRAFRTLDEGLQYAREATKAG